MIAARKLAISMREESTKKTRAKIAPVHAISGNDWQSVAISGHQKTRDKVAPVHTGGLGRWSFSGTAAHEPSSRPCGEGGTAAKDHRVRVPVAIPPIEAA